MKTSYRWLRDMVPGMSLSAEGLAEHLALRGAPVEDMTSPGEELADVVVGKVVSAEPHPNADRLSLCAVDGGHGVVSVVCGAPNVKAGAWYPFAPVGAVLPGDFKIKKAKIRGETSQGMLCSAKELGLGSEHDGILEIHGDFAPGQSFVQALGLDDATLDVEVTANRGDLLSHVGVARELASEGEGRVVLVDFPDGRAYSPTFERGLQEAKHGDVSIRIEDSDMCSRYLGAIIRGVKIGPSPSWLQERLRGAGSRSINNVVDATNYILLELGQPLHAFDLNELGGTSVVVRRAGASDKKFVTLDDEERKITPDMLMICDAEKPVAIAGVMGGLHSEVSSETVDILLECALFDPKSTRATRRALAMSTDASYRFERGVDPEGMEQALQRAVSLILSTAGGEVDGPVLDCHAVEFEAQKISLRLSRIERVLGVAIGATEATDLLTPLGFEVSNDADGVLTVRVPGFRSYDVTREVDLIEEVARAYGYDRFPADLGPFRPGTVPDHPLFQLEDELRRSLAARGLYEAQTPAFVPEGEGEVRVSNPLATTEPFIRSAILPSLLRRVEYNLARGNRDVRLFEMGTSFRAGAKGEAPHETPHLAVAVTGLREPAHWSSENEALGIWDLKSLLEDIARRAFSGAATVSPASEPVAPYQNGAAFVVTDPSGVVLGAGGVVDEGAVDLPVWAGEVLALELSLPAEPPRASAVMHEEMPLYPPVERDLALLVPLTVTSASVTDLIRSRSGDLLESVELFDVYRGDEVTDGHRSLAFRLRFRARERTLKDKEVERSIRSVLGRLKEELGVEHRG